MMTRLVSLAIAAFGLGVATNFARPQSAAHPETPRDSPALINTCLITNDVRGLAAFYTRVLQIEPQWSGDSYVEFRSSGGVLALFAADAQEKYIPGSAAPAQNRSAILEFRVKDVDREYSRLRDQVKWVKGPTTQPWGTRSIYFRDPDGNLIDFFVPPQKR